MLPRPHLIAAAIAATVIGGAIGRHRRQKIERAHPPAGNFQRTSNGLNLHYVEAGRGHPVVLLHGATSQLQDMTASLMPRLSLDYHVIAFDRPGHGYSDRLPYRAWAEAQAHAIHDAVRRMGLERPVIVGHSMGGAVAMAYGMLYPDELSGIVFLSGLAYAEVPSGSWLFGPAALPLVGNALVHTLYQPVQPVIVRSMLRKFFAPQQIPDRLLEELPIDMLCRPQAMKANSEDQMMTVPSLIDLQMHYENYPLPVQVIAGSQDRTTDPNAHAWPLSQQLPRAKLRLLPGIGHMVHHFAQDEIAEAVHELFDGALTERLSSPRRG